MDWIMEFRFMIYLFSELLLRIRGVPRPAYPGSGVQRWPGPSSLARSSLFKGRGRPERHGGGSWGSGGLPGGGSFEAEP